MKIEGKLDKALLAVGLFVGAIFWLVVGYVFIEDFLNKPAPTVVSVKCTDNGSREIMLGGEWFLAFETYYWSDGTKTFEGLEYPC